MKISFALILVSLLSCSSPAVESTVVSQQSTAIPGTTITEDPSNKEPEVMPQQQADVADIQYRVVSLYGGKLDMSVPVLFTEMPADKIAIKYPNTSSRPSVVYTNEKASVNIAFNQTAMSAVQDDLPGIQTMLSQQLQKAKPINFKSRIEKINGSNYVIFEFESQAADAKIYNLMFATDIDGKLLLGTLNCTESLSEIWKAPIRKMLMSLQKR